MWCLTANAKRPALKSSGLYISVFQDRPDRGANLCSKKAFFCGTQKMTTPFSSEINQKLAKNANCFLKSTKKGQYQGTYKRSRPAFACQPALKTGFKQWVFKTFLKHSGARVHYQKASWNTKQCYFQ